MKTDNQPVAMVVNDDRSQLRLITALLEKEGLRALPCQSAEQALQSLKDRGPVDVIVTDLYMPGMDGWNLCRLLRSPDYATHNTTPILAVSATFLDDDAHRTSVDLGADSFLPLPFTPAALRDRVQALLQGRLAKETIRILIADSDAEHAGQLRQAFQCHDYAVWIAATGEEACALYRQSRPDIVVLDHHLPDISGNRLLVEFKQSADAAIIMMMTDDASVSHPLAWMRQGADGYLHKPFDTEYLIELCKKARNDRSLMRVGELLKEQSLKLQASEARYRTLIENQGEGAAIVDQYESFTFCNPAGEAIFGVPPGALVGRNLQEFTDPDVMRIVQAQTEQHRHGNRTTYEFDFVRPDGEKCRLLVTGTPQYDDAGVFIGTFGVFRDITEQRKMEVELLKIEKMESVGILAGGIAHDFNNYLVAILGNISLAKLSAAPDDEAYERLNAAETAALRAKDLTHQLLTFSKGGVPVKKAASIGAIIQQTAEFALRGSNVRLELALPDDLWPAEVDKGQISQVISNLVINADQAMPDGGAIRIEAENTNMDGHGALPLAGKHYIKLTVRDQGAGIAEKHLSKIFDPYFTTKQKGSGLGLATCYSIIKNHEGHITVDSALGVGTTFTIYLPALPRENTTMRQPVENQSTDARGKVLVMDDDEIIRDVTYHIMRRLEYHVVFACDGAQAIELYQQARQDGQPFDVVILDLTVPRGLGGKETLQRLLNLDPQVKAIVSSGYSNDPTVSDFKKFGFKACLTKPYKVHELNAVLQQVISNHNQ
jgi:PAS domain S-box-containing protein